MNEDVRENQDYRLDADLRVVRDALENPRLWNGSDLALRALGRIENAVRTRMVYYRDAYVEVEGDTPR